VGPYRIEAVLGQGGMGRVFLARDTRDERAGPAAVKVLARTGDATAWSRFRRELAAARRVEGEGTARILDGDAEADPPWLAAEYIAGPTLDRLVAARGPVDVAAAAGLAVGVAAALGAIHAAGVVHRDLKPANIILGAHGPRVVDFGIARTADDASTLSVTGWATHPATSRAGAGTATTSAGTGAHTTSAAFTGGTVLAGPGCRANSWSVFSVTSPTLERGVGGGEPACGGAADAFRKSGSEATLGSRADWRFRFHRAVRCTLAVYVADADASSGRAVYQVTAHGITTTFTVDQAAAKGGAISPAAVTGLTAPDGVVDLVLTDRTATAGDTDHVTAASVAASCRPF
jgi:serine/threonine protein kinase